MAHKQRDSLKDLARYMVDKYTTIERLKKEDAQRRALAAWQKEKDLARQSVP